MLIDAGVEINDSSTKSKRKKFSPLFLAIQMDNAIVIELLCDVDVDLD